MLLQVDHTTIYRYARPATFKPHRLMVRPIEGHDVQIRSSRIEIQPRHSIRWLRDVFDNSVAMVDFLEPATELRVRSTVVVEQFNTNPFDFVLDPDGEEIPFRYRENELVDTTAFQRPQYPQDEPAVRGWFRPFLSAQGRARTVEFFTALGRSVPLYFQYVRRDEPGVQTPGETLRKRAGSCRDFALLFMEAARHLGLAARFVSGYLCRSEDAPHYAATDSTHAWAEIYLPGAGWKGFDPTCGILAADLNLRVAVAREPQQASPIQGAYSGAGADSLGLEVLVNARVIGPEGPGRG